MFRLKYLTPYLMRPSWYFDNHYKKIRPVYCSKIDGNLAAIVTYNDDLTEEVDGEAWFGPSAFEPYEEFYITRAQEQLDRMWEDHAYNNSNLQVVRLTDGYVTRVLSEKEAQLVIAKETAYGFYTPEDFTIMTDKEYDDWLDGRLGIYKSRKIETE